MRTFSSDIITILNSIRQTLADLLNPIPRVYSRVCVHGAHARAYTHRRKDCAREERPGKGRSKQEVLADAIDSQAGSRRDNAEDEGPPK